MDAVALRVRDRFLVRRAVQEAYTDHGVRTASHIPPPEMVQALVEGFFESRVGSTDREAALSAMKAVTRLMGVLKKAPGRVWAAISQALGLGEMEGMGFIDKVKHLASRARDLAKRGKDALGKLLKKASQIFPLSLYFIPKGKAPSLTDLMVRIAKKSPMVWNLLQKVKGGAAVVDKWLKKYFPRSSRVLLGAIFIFVWFNVAEISWDFEGLLAGFTGAISLPDLLSSLPESAVGWLAAMFGLGYGALPVTIIVRLVWLVAHHYIEWTGRGFRINWKAMGVEEASEEVAVT
jgi:hypothetical protein